MANYRRMTRRAARAHGLDPRIFSAQIQQESGFNPGARSPAGALGIAQIMPATARGWGVDPLNPRAALNAAAENMARYVKQFGSYEGALRAYNAGPGAVEASRGYGETNEYVRRILGGRSPSTAGVGGGGGGARITTRTPGVDRSRERAQLLQSFLDDEGDDRSIVDFALQMRGLRDTPGSSSTRTIRSGGGGRGVPRSGSQIKELFWQGPGGVNIKNGQRVPQGFVSGHADHVHVAAGPRTVDRFGRMAQGMGLHVGENPDFGGVAPVHTGGSFHYSDRAIDVSGDPAKMRQFAQRVARYQRRRRR